MAQLRSFEKNELLPDPYNKYTLAADGVNTELSGIDLAELFETLGYFKGRFENDSGPFAERTMDQINSIKKSSDDFGKFTKLCALLTKAKAFNKDTKVKALNTQYKTNLIKYNTKKNNYDSITQSQYTNRIEKTNDAGEKVYYYENDVISYNNAKNSAAQSCNTIATN